MDAARTPSGQTDTGDDVYGDSIIEAAREVLDSCVKITGRGGKARHFSKSLTAAILAVKHHHSLLCHVVHESDEFRAL